MARGRLLVRQQVLIVVLERVCERHVERTIGIDAVALGVEDAVLARLQLHHQMRGRVLGREVPAVAVRTLDHVALQTLVERVPSA